MFAHMADAASGKPVPMVARRSRIYGSHRRTPGGDVGAAGVPHVAQEGAVTTEAARRHLAGLNAHDRARPASSGGGATLLVLLLVVAAIVAIALAATGQT